METIVETSKLSTLADELAGNFSNAIPEHFKNSSLQAREALNGLEFPNTRAEYWKYTRTAPISRENWNFSKAAEIPEIPAHIKGLKIVFLNGHLDVDRSDMNSGSNFEITPFSKSETDVESRFSSYDEFKINPFQALNKAMPQDGYVLKVSAKAEIEKPITIVHLYTGENTISQPRNLVVLEKGSSAKIIEYHIHSSKAGKTFTNTCTQVIVEANARLGIDILQYGSNNSFHLQNAEILLARDARLVQNTFTQQGNWTRNNTNVRVQGENITADLNGFYIPDGSEHIDNHTVVDHEKSNSDSNELYRGVLLDKAVGVFNGKVFVRQDAQKTNAFQSNGNVLISDTATMNSKPELEIYADDVKCSHGSTTGQLNDEAIYYLQTRGLSKKVARKMLISAFAEDVLKHIVSEEIREEIEGKIDTKLAK
ncbi:MAG TPA: Fe-S cluster assembly protein SufD [Cryomorphaceae bacterium]|nr:Fe-S cluster assembly protein SufD [Cryomorphaceae bacterium]